MKKTADLNPQVDAYIGKAAPFAQPVLEHLRELVHKACPDVEETIKWRMPFFVYKAQILGNMAAFKAALQLGAVGGGDCCGDAEGWSACRTTAMGTFGKIASVKDLPADKMMLGYVRQAAAFVRGRRAKTMPRDEGEGSEA